ncbi:MAG: polymer-forming cytoskeletal protein [Thermonemataceae bacterium]|nr:polymer-forming cytoskeletal protein [Thermonemataceae bacterium]
MAIFNSGSKENKHTEVDKISNASTTIGKGATLQGNIDTFGNVRIDGRLVGDITSKSKVATGNASVVEGSIAAQNAEIEGEVNGSLEITELLVLKSTAIINGDIITAKMVVEAGAIFNGKCLMGDVTQIKQKVGKKSNEDASNKPSIEPSEETNSPTTTIFSDLKV